MDSPSSDKPFSRMQFEDTFEWFSLALMMAVGLAFLENYFWAFELFAHFRLQYFIGSGLLFVIAIMWRFKRVALASAFVLAINAMAMWPFLHHNSPSLIGNEHNVRFISANVLSSNPHKDKLLDYIQQTSPDVVLLLEVNDNWIDRLSALSESYPYSIIHPQSDNFGIALYSKIPYTGDLYFVKQEQYRVPYIHADFPTINTTFFGIHPLPPTSKNYIRHRNIFMKHIAERIAPIHNRAVITIGDFNNTLSARSFRNFLAHSQLYPTTNGLRATWPTGLGALGIQIDHALIKNIRHYNFRTGPSIGSDHRPIILDITLPTRND